MPPEDTKNHFYINFLFIIYGHAYRISHRIQYLWRKACLSFITSLSKGDPTIHKENKNDMVKQNRSDDPKK